MTTPSAKKNSAIGIHGRMTLLLVRRQPGLDERPELIEQDRHREDDPDDQRDLDLDDERVTDTEDLERHLAERPLEEFADVGGEVEATADASATAMIDRNRRVRSSPR